MKAKISKNGPAEDRGDQAFEATLLAGGQDDYEGVLPAIMATVKRIPVASAIKSVSRKNRSC